MNQFSVVWFPTLVMLAAQICAALAMLTITVLVPLAARDYGVPATWIGGFTSLVYLVAAVCGAVTGDWIRRFGAIRITQFAMLSSAAGLVCFASSQPLLAVLAAVLLGASYGQLNPVSSDVLVRCSPVHLRPFIFSIKQTGVVFGGVLAGALAPVCANRFGWSGAALLVAVVVASMWLLLAPLRRRFDIDDKRDHVGQRRRGLARVVAPVQAVMTNPRLRWLAIASLGFSGIQVCLATFLVLFLTEFRGLSLAVAGSLYALNQAAGVTGRLFWGYCSGRWLSARNTLLVVALLSALALVAIAITGRHGSTLIIALIVLVLGVASFGWNGVMLSEVSERVDVAEVGDATGGVQFVFFGGVVLIPPLFGLLVVWLGYAVAFASLSLLAVATAALILVGFGGNPGPHRTGT